MRKQTEEYKNYIASDEWNIKRHERMKIDDYRCVMCGADLRYCKKPQVHHITYKRLGHEDVLKDLASLCGGCHIKIHRFYNRRTE